MAIDEGIFQNIIAVDGDTDPAIAGLNLIAAGFPGGAVRIYTVGEDGWIAVNGVFWSPGLEGLGDISIGKKGESAILAVAGGLGSLHLTTGVLTIIQAGFGGNHRVHNYEGVTLGFEGGSAVYSSMPGAAHTTYPVTLGSLDLDIYFGLLNPLWLDGGYVETHNIGQFGDESEVKDGEAKRLIAFSNDSVIVIEPLKLYNHEPLRPEGNRPAFFGMYVTVWKGGSISSQFALNYRYPTSVESNSGKIRIKATKYVKNIDEEYDQAGSTDMLFSVGLGGLSLISEGPPLTVSVPGFSIASTARHVDSDTIYHFMKETDSSRYPRQKNKLALQSFSTGELFNVVDLDDDSLPYSTPIAGAPSTRKKIVNKFYFSAKTNIAQGQGPEFNILSYSASTVRVANEDELLGNPIALL